MKNMKWIGRLLIGVMLFTSCNEFLDVTPRTETPQDKLFATEVGFKDALAGVYIQMKDNNAYGKALSYDRIERLVSSWDVAANTTDQRLGQFNYSDEGVENALASSYGQLYKVISSVNAILGEIDKRKDVFKTSGLYEVIKGESLAIRAYCHLDILRLFGPIPSDPTNGNKLAYVTTLSNKLNSLTSFDEYKNLLLKDLEEAEKLLHIGDPILEKNVQGAKDSYLSKRTIRMNYYAVKALSARTYLWFGNKEKAYENAKIVIEAKNKDGVALFKLGTSTDMTTQNYLLTGEHIFGLYDFKLFSKYSADFASGNFYKGASSTTIQNELYGNTGMDIREAYLWEQITLANQARRYVMKKYKVLEKLGNTDIDTKQIPMLRLSELFLIAAETAPIIEANALWSQFYFARNVPVTALADDPIQRQMQIMKEYRKEFYAEGQSFYAYKRLNAGNSNFLFLPAGVTVNYLVPLPKTETVNLN
ncbi:MULTISPECIES: RagB/SusD family nutrient uptake outer membrane protein [Sphingobacterium]|uniref:RagB/SusD family nutrient uptake outer membrane protein n=1 Tax=Sphingobacterium TaxID=28453 RepID=UPI0013DA09C5|nr:MULTISPECIES: RagB/SusD family nutrient uptake outer membrane protein [unclassified Sphingobacterium]